MTAGKTGPKAFLIEEQLSKHGIQFGMLWGPTSYKTPWCEYALDNDCFNNSHTPDWWKRDGEYRWLKMLDKVAMCERQPLFAALPDVVGNWDATMDLSSMYLPELKNRGIKSAVVLQDNSSCENAFAIGANAFFVGGSVKWKWENAAEISAWCKSNNVYLHIGQVNGIKKIRRCIELGVDSCDGSGLSRFQDAMIPLTIRAFENTAQGRFLFV